MSSQIKINPFPYERQAMNGEEMPDGIEYPDQICFLLFRNLYAQLRMGIIGQDIAIREKRKILKEYEQYKFVESNGKRWVRIIKETELARSAYRKQRTIENADALLIAIDGGNYGKQVSESV